MFRYFARLRNAPLEERRRAAVVITLLTFVIILILWFGVSLLRSELLTNPAVPAPQGSRDIAPPY